MNKIFLSQEKAARKEVKALGGKKLRQDETSDKSDAHISSFEFRCRQINPCQIYTAFRHRHLIPSLDHAAQRLCNSLCYRPAFGNKAIKVRRCQSSIQNGSVLRLNCGLRRGKGTQS